MPIPHVQRGRVISSDHQNELIDQVNQNTQAIANLGGDPVAIEEMISEAIEEHRNDSAPHPAYDDDSHRFDLIFLNGLV